jgi:hypothetical protein
MPRSLRLLLVAFLSASAYHAAYLYFLHKEFEYADFRYELTSVPYFAWTYLAVAIPIVFARKSRSPSAVGALLIYILSYTPIQMTLTFMWREKTLELITLQATLLISMALIFLTSKTRAKLDNQRFICNSFIKRGFVTYIVYLLTGVGISLVLIEYHSIMRFPSFEEVYELRDMSSDLQVSVVAQYFVMWITYCFGPFFIARALHYHSKIDYAVGFLLLLVVYMTTGAKIAILTPFFMLAMRWIDNDSRDFQFRLLFITAIFVHCITILIPNDGVIKYINSVFLLRMFGSNGWLGAVYYEYFSNHDFTLYTHIRPIEAIFGGYPYGEKSLGQIISWHYFSHNANFSAGFWPSDGFAAFGIGGVLIVTLLLILIMRIFDNISRPFDVRFLNLWLLGLWMGIINAPLATSMLSGGGIIIMFLIWIARAQSRN